MLDHDELTLIDHCDDGAISQLAALFPENPFCTLQYVQSLKRRGKDVWLAIIRRDGQVTWGSVGILERGRLCKTLHLVSLCTREAPCNLWSELRHACRRRGVDELQLNSLASPETIIPQLDYELQRSRRREYVLTLDTGDAQLAFAANHRRNIAKAIKRGVSIREGRDDSAIEAHISLQSKSMERRTLRGENAPDSFSMGPVKAFVASGVGRIFQAQLDASIVSSIVVLVSERGAYYQSAGTSAEGMNSGASQFLIHSVSELLRAEGIRRFSLGGVNQGNDGLDRFKSGFGAEPVSLDAVRCFTGRRIKRQLVSLIRGLRERLTG